MKTQSKPHTKWPLAIASWQFTALCIVLALAAFLPAHAQSIPALVNYQGRLANPDGSPLATADYQLSFSIYDSATNSGNLIWGPQVFDGQSAQGHGPMIPVVQGYFNVMLGPVDVNNASLANAFNATNRFVQITVSTNPPIRPEALYEGYSFASATAPAAA